MNQIDKRLGGTGGGGRGGRDSTDDEVLPVQGNTSTWSGGDWSGSGRSEPSEGRQSRVRSVGNDGGREWTVGGI